jgi:hypothetical protein
MKKFIIALLLLLTTSSYSQDKTKKDYEAGIMKNGRITSSRDQNESELIFSVYLQTTILIKTSEEWKKEIYRL